MNIFVTDLNPKLAAQSYHNRHVVKMILETAQMLCNVQYSLDEIDNQDIPYKKTHYNHPCSIWARSSYSNYEWLWSLGKEISKEYSYRYGKTHLSYKKVIHDAMEVDLSGLPTVGMTEFALAMPDKYKIIGDPVQSYRNYYVGEKLTQKGGKKSEWKKRNPPRWISLNNNNSI